MERGKYPQDNVVTIYKPEYHYYPASSMLLAMLSQLLHITDAFGKPDITTALWMANHIAHSQVYLDGSGRLNHLIALYLYPSYVYGANLKITRTIELNILRSYTFTPGTIITARNPLTIGASTVQGLSDTMLSEYIENMPKHLNKVFSNSICEVFVPR